MFRTRIVAGLVGSLLPLVAYAQTGVVTGTVRDAGTNQPIVGVAVAVTGTSLGALTNDRGLYRIERVRPGLVTITAQSLGYKKLTSTVTVAAAAPVTENLR